MGVSAVQSWQRTGRLRGTGPGFARDSSRDCLCWPPPLACSEMYLWLKDQLDQLCVCKRRQGLLSWEKAAGGPRTIFPSKGGLLGWAHMPGTSLLCGWEGEE